MTRTEVSARTIAIGDIHGCHDALRAIIEAIAPLPSDTIVTLGDYIDRGPNSHAVVEQVLALRERCELVTLLGNHELMFLSAKRNPTEQAWWESVGGAATLLSYRDATEPAGDDVDAPKSSSAVEAVMEAKNRMDWIPQAHIDFFESCALAYETDTHIFLHANYDPNVPISEQSEDVLLWQHLSPQQIPAPHLSGKQVIVGHTPQFSGEILDLGHLICIDTFCFGDGWLTALDVGSGKVWQANKVGELRGS